MYDDLTRSIWMNIFQCGEQIFDPLENIDSRFKLEDQYKNDVSFSGKMRKGKGSVMKAMEGEVELSHHHKKLTPFKHGLLSREISIQQVGRIFSIYRNNSIQNVYLNTDDIRTAFIPNLNIKEISEVCLLYTSPSPRDLSTSRMPSSA